MRLNAVTRALAKRAGWAYGQHLPLGVAAPKDGVGAAIACMHLREHDLFNTKELRHRVVC